MYSRWTDHIKDPEEKKRFEGSIVAAKSVLDRLKDILKMLDSGVSQDEFKKDHYEKPSWAFRQAHDNGYRHCIRTVDTLIDLDKQVIKEKE